MIDFSVALLLRAIRLSNATSSCVHRAGSRRSAACLSVGMKGLILPGGHHEWAGGVVGWTSARSLWRSRVAEWMIPISPR
ncbi:MAG: hypothetical protein R2687_04825 [Candidatus Nanopelagicales bacterium]